VIKARPGHASASDLDAKFSANAEIAAPPQNVKELAIEAIVTGNGIAARLAVTLKIEKSSDGQGTTIRLIGRIRAQHLEELEKQIEESESKIALDLEQVTLVDVQAVRFLGWCEAQGVTLRNCSLYITDWIAKERFKQS